MQLWVPLDAGYMVRYGIQGRSLHPDQSHGAGIPFYNIQFSCLPFQSTTLVPHLVKREHVTRNVSLREPCSSIGKEVSPLPLERLERGVISKLGISFRHRVHRHVRLQSTTPFPQRPRVVSSVILDGLNREPVLGCFGRGVDQRRGAWERRVGPHVAAHEVLWLASPVTGLWERGRSDNSCGVLVLQSPVDELEVGLVVLSAHMLRTCQFSGRRERKRERHGPLASPRSRRHRNDRPIR